VAVVYFKSEGDGDGTYDGQVGHAYLELDDDSGDVGEYDLGFLALKDAVDIARTYNADLDVDGPTREEWDADASPRRSVLDRLLRR
jgi:hypothetical protein